MTGRRMLYLAVLAACVVFYGAYGQWLAWFVLVLVLALPWFSLLISLPAMVRFHVSPAGPGLLKQGEDGDLWLLGSCPLPMPPFRGKLRLKWMFTGESWLYQEKEDLDSAHCGAYTVTAESVRICDYLGIFTLPVRCREEQKILILPKQEPVKLGESVHRFTARGYRPKFGGGFAENHELRLYRPGDNLNQIHWKLSAKTGNLMLREPMEPQRGLILVTMNLRGQPEQLDRKFGRLLWLGDHLLEKDVAFELRCLTGRGLLTFPVGTKEDLNKAVERLLCAPLCDDGDLRDHACAASWQYHIGGDADEA